MTARIRISSKPLFEGSISPLIYGDFVEFLNDMIPGMWAEKVQDRSFAGVLQPNHVWPPGADWVYPRWKAFVCSRPDPLQWPDSGAELEMVTAAASFELDSQNPFVGRHSARVRVEAGDGRPFLAGIAQEGIAVKQGEQLGFECYLRCQAGEDAPVSVRLGRNYGAFFRTYDTLEFSRVTDEWGRFAGTLTSEVSDENASLGIGITRPGTFWLDKVSLMPADNRCGWRPDVVEAVRAMKPGLIRFGGSSLIFYEWESGIGPRERRVPFENRPWGNMEEHDVGLHEFLIFCELVEAEPLICLNSNAATLEQIMAEIEYCNGPVASPYGSVRAAMGHPESFHVKYWQIGNEQRGEAYEQVMIDVARAIRRRHPELVLLASYPSDNILLHLSDAIDFICPHFYTPYSRSGEEEIRGLIATIEQKARNRDLKLGITEWNHTADHWGWGRAWLLTLYNALNAARMLNMYQRLGNWIRIANRSNMTNSCCSGVIQTSRSDLYFTPCYFVQKAYANFSGETALEVEAPSRETLDLSATRGEADGSVTLFVVNWGSEAQSRLVDVAALEVSTNKAKVWSLTNPSLDAANSFEEKERVAPKEIAAELQGNAVEYEFPAYSVTALRFR